MRMTAGDETSAHRIVQVADGDIQAGRCFVGRRIVQFSHRVTHVLSRFLQGIEFLLLIRRQDRTDLRHRLVHDGMRLFHRVFVNRDDLRPGLIDERLDLGLLIGGEIQRFGQMPHRKSLTVPTTVASVTPMEVAAAFGFRKSVASERDRADGSECK